MAVGRASARALISRFCRRCLGSRGRSPSPPAAARPLNSRVTPGHFLWQAERVTSTEAIKLLEKFRAGGMGRDKVLQAFQAAPVADLGFAQVDTHRALRKGFPEVIFGAGKTPEQVVKIAAKLLEREQRVLVTRVTPEHARALRRKFRHAKHHATARCVTIEQKPLPKRARDHCRHLCRHQRFPGGRGGGCYG